MSKPTRRHSFAFSDKKSKQETPPKASSGGKPKRFSKWRKISFSNGDKPTRLSELFRSHDRLDKISQDTDTPRRPVSMIITENETRNSFKKRCTSESDKADWEDTLGISLLTNGACNDAKLDEERAISPQDVSFAIQDSAYSSTPEDAIAESSSISKPDCDSNTYCDDLTHLDSCHVVDLSPQRDSLHQVDSHHQADSSIDTNDSSSMPQGGGGDPSSEHSAGSDTASALCECNDCEETARLDELHHATSGSTSLSRNESTRSLPGLGVGVGVSGVGVSGSEDEDDDLVDTGGGHQSEGEHEGDDEDVADGAVRSESRALRRKRVLKRRCHTDGEDSQDSGLQHSASNSSETDPDRLGLL